MRERERIDVAIVMLKLRRAIRPGPAAYLPWSSTKKVLRTYKTCLAALEQEVAESASLRQQPNMATKLASTKTETGPRPEKTLEQIRTVAYAYSGTRRISPETARFGNFWPEFVRTHDALLAAIERLEAAEGTNYWKGKRVRMRPNCIRNHNDWPLGEKPRDAATIVGVTLGEPVLVEQEWLPVKWDDRDDPDFIKLSTIMVLGVEQGALAGEERGK